MSAQQTVEEYAASLILRHGGNLDDADCARKAEQEAWDNSRTQLDGPARAAITIADARHNPEHPLRGLLG